MTSSDQFKYRAFISYSHAADEHIAPQLQKALSQFARPWHKIRALRIFRDHTNLALHPHLWVNIQQALDQSQYFILLASPDAAQSEWVQREIAHWLATRSPETLLIVLTKGEIVWDRAARDFDWTQTTALPATLSGTFTDEPLYSDFREAGTGADLSLKNPDFRNRIARIAATLHGENLDDLIGEDVEQHRKFTLFTRSVVAGLAALLIALSVASWTAWKQRATAVSRELAAKSLAQVAAHPELGLLLALEAIEISQTAEAEQALRDVSIKASVRLDLKRAEKEANAGPRAKPFHKELDSPDGSLVLRLSAGSLQVVDARTNAPLASFSRHTDTIASAAFSPDGALIASVDEGGGAYVWQARTGETTSTCASPSPRNSLSSVLWSPDGRVLAIGGYETLHLLEAARCRQIHGLDGHSGWVEHIAFSRDSRLLATGSVMKVPGSDPVDQAVYVWETKTGKLIHEFTDAGRELASLGFSADGMFVVADSDGTTRIWDAISGDQVASRTPYELSVAPHMDEAVRKITAVTSSSSDDVRPGISNVAFTPDGRFLITVDNEGGATVWGMSTIARHARFATFTDNVSRRFTFSSDGTKAIAKDYEKVRVWDIATKTELLPTPSELAGEIATFLRDAAEVREALSPDVRRRLGRLSEDSPPPVAAAFSPDGLKIAISDGSKIMRIHRWEEIAPRDELIAMARRRAGRQLTPQEREQFVPTFAQLVWRRLRRR